MKIPSKPPKYIQDFFTEMAWMFEIQNYTKSISIKKEKSEDGFIAEIHQDYKYKEVTISIYPEFWNKKKIDQRKILLHEFCHTITEELSEIAENLLNGKLEAKHHIEKAAESATCKMENLLDALLTGGRIYAKKAYKKFIK